MLSFFLSPLISSIRKFPTPADSYVTFTKNCNKAHALKVIEQPSIFALRKFEKRKALKEAAAALKAAMKASADAAAAAAEDKTEDEDEDTN